MPRRSRSALLAVTLWLSPGLAPAMAGPNQDCRPRALDHLRAASPDGWATYTRIGQPDVFETWIDCDDTQYDLPTAVHESTHVITAETDAFPLIGGGTVPRPHDASAFSPPSRLAKSFTADDFTTIYLRLGKASSATDFLYLLDELNASAIDLKALAKADESVDHRDGLAAMMAFVAVYAERARDDAAANPEATSQAAWTWRGLRSPPVAHTISVLWGQAETVMIASCGIPNFGHSDRDYIRRFCAAGPRSALEPILGRAPVCPTACLAPTDDDVVPTGTLPRASTSSRSTAGPSWIRAVIRSLATSGGSGPDESLPGDAPR